MSHLHRVIARDDTRSANDVFFFQAEAGIRDSSVTGVQTCALPISLALPGIVDETAPAPMVVQRGPTAAQRREMERALARLNSVEVDREFATPQEAEQFLREELEKSNQPAAPITPLMQAEDLVDQAAAARGRKRLKL